MDKATLEELAVMADRLYKMKRFAGKAADEACAAGDYENSALLRKIEGHLTFAYAEGRCMMDATGGPVVLGGGK